LLQAARDSLSAFQSLPQMSGVRLAGGSGGADLARAADAGQATASRLAAEAQLQAQRMLVQRLESATASGDGAAMRVAMASAPAGTVSPLVGQLAERVSAMQSARDSLTTG